ncbi:MAG TPA: hypothetical protein DHW34_06720 [Actinobacteria bacterium]|nr:hypothetical protein [Actinomycetota bacterium]
MMGTGLMAVGALGVGYLPERAALASWPLIEQLRTTTPGAVFSKIVVAIGAIVLLRAWLLLGGDIRQGRILDRRRLNQVLLAWSLPLLLVPPLFSQDVYSYIAQGNLLRLGLDPYTMAPSAIPGPFLEAVSPWWLDTPTPYGPLFLLACKWVVVITGEHIFVGALLLRGLALVGVWLIAQYLPEVAERMGVNATTAVWAGLLNPLVLMHFVSGAHNDAVMVGLIVAGLAMALRGRFVIAVLLISMAGAIKIPALVVLGFVGLIAAGSGASLTLRIRKWALAAVVCVATFVVLNLLAGVGFGWIKALGTPGLVRSWISPVTSLGVGVGWLGSAVGLGDHTEGLLLILRTIATVAVVAYAVRLLLHPGQRHPVRAAGIVLLLLAIFGPVVQPWYLLWGLVVLAAAGYRRRELPYLIAATTGMVVHGLTQSSATSADVLQVSDPVSAALAISAAVIGILSDRRTRTEILQAGEHWAQAHHLTLHLRHPHADAMEQHPSATAGKMTPRERP